MEKIEVSRDEIIEHLISSWRDHYEMMDDDFLVQEYKEDISEDPDYEVEITLVE